MELKIVTIDCNELKDKESAHEYLQALFAFPDYYGKNLDALFDCLTEMPGCCIVLEEPWALAQLGDYAAPLLQAFRDAAAEREDLILL